MDHHVEQNRLGCCCQFSILYFMFPSKACRFFSFIRNSFFFQKPSLKLSG
uniref:Uncharacterized protein n=1 Tax=Setaria italica TaxID=4555 RepID=K3ZPH4_SETIT